MSDRRHIRFKPDSDARTEIDFEPYGDFNPSIAALVIDESYLGAGVVILHTERLQIGDECRIRIGNLGPSRAVVRWRTAIDPKVLKIGIEIIEA